MGLVFLIVGRSFRGAVSNLRCVQSHSHCQFAGTPNRYPIRGAVASGKGTYGARILICRRALTEAGGGHEIRRAVVAAGGVLSRNVFKSVAMPGLSETGFDFGR
jgi:hypothetical protein